MKAGISLSSHFTGLPVPVNLRIAKSTNSTISLMWENASPSTETIQTTGFLVKEHVSKAYII